MVQSWHDGIKLIPQEFNVELTAEIAAFEGQLNKIATKKKRAALKKKVGKIAMGAVVANAVAFAAYAILKIRQNKGSEQSDLRHYAAFLLFKASHILII